jgi:UDP-2-acetamido-3-amino-2,3-dideoxy-glucuronate N-acetyltransferase
MRFFVHPTAIVDTPCSIGDGTKIWHFVHVCSGARIGASCVIGQNVMIGNDVLIGNRVKIQNNVAVYTGVTVEDEVFLGPSCVLTNVSNPRSQVNRHALYEKSLLRRGATVGANATILCGVTLGRYSFVSAGTVVTRSVPDYGWVVGVPGRLRGWMSRHGHPMKPDSAGLMRCPESGLRYQVSAGGSVICLDLPEEASLPAELALGRCPFASFKGAASPE